MPREDSVNVSCNFILHYTAPPMKLTTKNKQQFKCVGESYSIALNTGIIALYCDENTFVCLDVVF